MHIDDYDSGVRACVGAIVRGKSSAFALAHSPKVPSEFALSVAVGSAGVMHFDGGTLLSLAVTRANLLALRDQCNELLKNQATVSPIILL